MSFYYFSLAQLIYDYVRQHVCSNYRKSHAKLTFCRSLGTLTCNCNLKKCFHTIFITYFY